ncbi:phosphate starvation-inducible protein PhoH [Virgibacillus profundi]|uniref:Phosphate starvation-inducible protein PhoH n=1 Tax=Virgibacillus profundi TaxID=2024555 RepID=A0A2A2IGD1_9BACI|nr:PhoH family protein [Virgibacillus profundi]PAV30190.1 phosphate starvation-inducible protein PhoH [Virgibacillus profundi]PXY54362.1 phosphate starvation-inducible protein PhoH [Virgibacillus profundi]
MPLPKDNLLFGYANKLTNEQKEYVDSIIDNQLTIVNARSGTGKTTLAVACAKIIGKDLLYVFSPVEENSLGFTPGSVEEKEMKYIQPLKDALIEINEHPDKVIATEENVENVKNGNTWVEAKSHVFARGTNIKNKTVILDEVQNFTKSELRKLLTRIHDDCTVIMIGHTGQIDLERIQDSGFLPYIEHFKNKDYAHTCELSWNFRGRLANDADELI